MSRRRQRPGDGDGDGRPEKVPRRCRIRVRPKSAYVKPSLLERMPNELILRVMRAMDGETFFAFRKSSKHINNLFLRGKWSQEDEDNMELVAHTLNAWLETFLTDEEIARGFVGRDVLRVGVHSLYNLSHWDNEPVKEYDGHIKFLDYQARMCKKISDEVTERLSNPPYDEWPTYKEPTKFKLGRRCQDLILGRMRNLAKELPAVVGDIIERGVIDGFGVSVDLEFYHVWRKMRNAGEDDAWAVKKIAVILRETQNVPLLAITLLLKKDMRKMRDEKERLLYLVTVSQLYPRGVEQMENRELILRHARDLPAKVGLDWWEFGWFISRESPWSYQSENGVNRALQELSAMRIAHLHYDDDDYDLPPSISQLMRISTYDLNPESVEDASDLVDNTSNLFAKLSRMHPDGLAPYSLAFFPSWDHTSKDMELGYISHLAKVCLVLMSKLRILPPDFRIASYKELEDILMKRAHELTHEFYLPLEFKHRQDPVTGDAPYWRPYSPPMTETLKLIRHARKAYGLPPRSKF